MRQLVALIRRRFPQAEVRFVDTVCKPTKERQSAAVEIARQARHRHRGRRPNGQQHARTGQHLRPPLRPASTTWRRKRDLRPEWFAGVESRGLTAGTSTPDDVIERVEPRIRDCAGATAGQVRFARTRSSPLQRCRTRRRTKAAWNLATKRLAATGRIDQGTRWDGRHRALPWRWPLWSPQASYSSVALVDRIEPYQANPLPDETAGALGNVELWREAATLVMLATRLRAESRGGRGAVVAGYTAIAFGTWDIPYYVFLRMISGWPKTLLDWDVLFLLPLPWWGPVLAPVSIAALMILWGTLATQSDGDDAVAAHWVWAPRLRRNRPGVVRLHGRRVAGTA